MRKLIHLKLRSSVPELAGTPCLDFAEVPLRECEGEDPDDLKLVIARREWKGSYDNNMYEVLFHTALDIWQAGEPFPLVLLTTHCENLSKSALEQMRAAHRMYPDKDYIVPWPMRLPEFFDNPPAKKDFCIAVGQRLIESRPAWKVFDLEKEEDRESFRRVRCFGDALVTRRTPGAAAKSLLGWVDRPWTEQEASFTQKELLAACQVPFTQMASRTEEGS